MAKGSTDTRWRSSGNGGGQVDWIERDGRFSGVDDGSGFHAFDDLDMEQLLPRQPAKPCDKSECPAPFPTDFSHCPDCSCELTPAFASSDRLWSYPGGEGDGLLNVESVDIRAVSEPVDGGFPSPEAQNLIFVVAGQPRRLLAIDRYDSNIFVFNREKRSWRNCASTILCNYELPTWSWSIVATNEGFALAGTTGPIFARLNALGNAVIAEPSAGGDSVMMAGPGRLDSQILFLCLREDGLAVIAYSPQKKEWSKRVPVKGAPASLNAQTGAFAAPSARSNTLFWTGPTGYVAVRAKGGELEAFWKVWSQDFEPQCQIRPLWAQNSLWQFGVRGKGVPQFEQLVFHAQARTNEVSAVHLTAGECSFTSGMKHYVMPWDETSAMSVGNNDSFLMPICGLAGLSAIVADCGFDPNNRRVNPGELLVSNATPRPASLRIHKPGTGSIDLRRVIKIGSLLQLQALVFDGLLLVYDSEYGIFASWKIS